ncbi:MAG: hypothetical protein KPEEDBHJ_01865 [Anaerolineales bacterium]|nr:hypothetical protein [Anaerolineales bacterium]
MILYYRPSLCVGATCPHPKETSENKEGSPCADETDVSSSPGRPTHTLRTYPVNHAPGAEDGGWRLIRIGSRKCHGVAVGVASGVDEASVVGPGVSVGRGVEVAVGEGVGVFRYGGAVIRVLSASIPLMVTT